MATNYTNQTGVYHSVGKWRQLMLGSRGVGTQPEQVSKQTTQERQDLRYLWLGIGASFGFTLLIWLLGARLEALHTTFLPDSGAAWYWWQLPARDPWARATAWGFYLLHQIAIWALIFVAQRAKSSYRTSLHWFNYAALGVNALFGLVHLAQTHIWYDGLAQDVSIWSSQWSVIIMLVLIVLMENRRRGMFFGYKAPLSTRAIDFVRKYHGYIFAWAITYTFWYHPTEATQGHLLGFFYTFMLMVQGSLFFTRAHLNRWWTFTLEFFVMIHGVLVAVTQPSNMWPMFGFGFAGVLVVTQMHGLGLSRWVRGLLLALYIGAALLVYNSRGFDQLYQISFIPITYYVSVLVIAGVVGLIAWLIDALASHQNNKHDKHNHHRSNPQSRELRQEASTLS